MTNVSRWLGVLLLGSIVGSGCDLLPIPTPQVLVSDGGDTKPLVQVIPRPGDHAATIVVAEISTGGLGMEGAVAFVSATDAAGNLVLDRIVDPRGGIQQKLDPAEYTFVAYYRTCDANCGFLDDPTEFCTVTGTVEPEATYRLAVTPKGCKLTRED